MSYSLSFVLGLGSSRSGYSDLRAQIVDTAGVAVGAAVSLGFIAIGTGFYLWTGSIPDGHQGAIYFYRNSDPSTILCAGAINAQEAENLDAKVSSRAAPGAEMDLVADAVDANALGATAATELLATAVEGSLTVEQVLRLLLSVMAGKSSGGGTATVVFRDSADTKNRVQATVDASGNRTAVSLDAS